MRSRAEIVADVGDDGRPVLARLRAEGAVAVRWTGGGRSIRCCRSAGGHRNEVHLVGTAAGPLGGDVVEISVLVRAGAGLRLRGVGATLALPGRAAGIAAESRLDLTVEDGGTLDHAPPPLVVCAGARLVTTTHLTLAASARADVTELVVLGRHGEPGGDWTGRITADRTGRPVLRSTQRSVVLAASPRPARAVLTRLRTSGVGDDPLAACHGGAVACPLPSGDLLVTSIGPDASSVARDASAAASRARCGSTT